MAPTQPQQLKFTLNGEEYTVSRGLQASYTLAEFLRDQADLRGTKVTCREGGCGACTVLLTRGDGQGKEKTVSVNSCLVPVYGLHGAKVTTIEGLGGRKKGYHPVQRRLAEMHGSQCGYCSPGMVMSICGSLCSSKTTDKAKMEKALDGNLCRCTGFRPILDAAKSFISDASCVDIEDLTRTTCSNAGDAVDKSTKSEYGTQQLLTSTGSWFKTRSLSEVFTLLENCDNKRPKLVVGNTSNGVMKTWADLFIDISDVPQLKEITIGNDSVTFGATVTLTSMIDQCQKIANTQTGFQYLGETMAPHLETIGSTAIRNIACWAGNLMVHHDFQEFPSDLVPSFAAVNAVLKIATKTSTKKMLVEEFLKQDMKNKVLVSVTFPAVRENERMEVFKVKARNANSHAYISGGFYAKLTKSNAVEEIRIGYVGLRRGFMRPTNTENFMKGKCITDQKVVAEALEVLNKEAEAESNGIPDNEFRIKTAVNLFYKFVMTCLGEEAGPGTWNSLALTPRGLSNGIQDYQEIEQNFPLNKAVPAVTALQQTAGEIRYTDDIPRQERELIAVYVPSQQAKGRIVKIDTMKAKQVSGVHSILLQEDLNQIDGDKVLADERVSYAGQPIAIVLANNERAARRAGRLVEVTLADAETPILDLKEAIEKDNFIPLELDQVRRGDTEEALSNSDHVLEGECNMGSQYHMYIENIAVLTIPTEEGFDVWSSSQFPTLVQSEVAKAVGLSSNCVNAMVTQVGGGFGGKVTNIPPFAVMAALSAKHCGRPVRLALSLQNCIESTSKRFPYLGKYKVGFSKSGRIQGLRAQLYQDFGIKPIMFSTLFFEESLKFLDGAYCLENVLVEGKAVKTDKMPPTTMRAPAKYPVAIIMENVMAKIAHYLDKPLWEVQETNFYQENMTNLAGVHLQECKMGKVWDELKETTKLDEWQADINTFNQSHRWIKRGLATAPCSYSISYSPFMQYPAYVAIYASDGSVSVAHGGVEMGQGINTKVTQMVAKILGVPIELIKIKATNVVTGNNGGPSAGSVTMELLTRTVKDCCTILAERIHPFRDTMQGKSWNEIISACYWGKVDLSAHSRHVEDAKVRYQVYSALAAEAEVDILTGERRINRADVVFDCGESLNPAIDIGQIEGALVMSLGHMLFEKEVYDPKSGRVLSNTTWDYKPPTCMDIPTKMNIHLLKDTCHSAGVLPAKALGEPPMCMAAAFQLAVGKAIEASRMERGKKGFVQLEVPATADKVQKACDTELEDLTF